MSGEHASGHAQNRGIRTLVFCGTAILLFLNRALCKKKVDFDLKRIKTRYQFPYKHILLTGTIKTTYYCAVFIQEYKINVEDIEFNSHD